MPVTDYSEDYVIFVRVGGGREPIGLYSGAGKTISDSQEDAKRKCRDDLGVEGFDLFAVLAEHCARYEVQRAREAQTREVL